MTPPALRFTLSDKAALILELLCAGQQSGAEMYGLQLVASSNQALKRGTVYVTLGRMEEKGYVTSRLEDAPPEAGGLPRRLYRATPLGRHVLTAWTQATTHLREAFAQ